MVVKRLQVLFHYPCEIKSIYSLSLGVLKMNDDILFVCYDVAIVDVSIQ